MNKNRPYFNSSSADIADLVEENINNTDELKIILFELSYRKAKRAKELKAQIESILDTSPEEIIKTPKVNQQKNISEIKRKAINDKGSDEPVQNYDHKFSLVDSKEASNSTEQKWHSTLREDDAYKLDKNKELLLLYIDALDKHVLELKKLNRNNLLIDLIDGKKINEATEFNLYKFQLEDPLELFEGASVEIFIKNSLAKAKVSNLLDKSVVLEFTENHGNTIERCTVKIDKTQLILSLHDKLKNISQGEISNFNKELAENVIKNTSEDLEPELERNIIDIDELNKEQKIAVGKSLSNKVTYIWGPPGTGKTKTLGVLIKNLFNLNEKSLIASNTNQAVDQVLLKLCQELGRDHPALVEGKIIRRGKIDLQELEDEWSELIDIDSITETKGKDLKIKIQHLENQISMLNEQSAKFEKILTSFKALDEKILKETIETRNLKDLESLKTTHIDEEHLLKEDIAQFKKELKERETAGPIRKLLLRNERTIISQINSSEQMLQDTKKEIAEMPHKIRTQTTVVNSLQEDVKELKEAVKDKDKNKAQAELNKINEKKGPLEGELANIRSELENLRNKILDEAKVVGATVTRTYVHQKEFTGFKNVIIDEASMVLLPALYHVVGLASERCIISGDFRQIAPIVNTRQKDLHDVISKDIFDISGIANSTNSGKKTKNLIMLKQQYRMQDNICNLINSFMYRGNLITAESKLNTPTPSLIDGANKNIILIDTSRLFPFSQKKGTSYYNLMHAITVRNLVKQLRQNKNDLSIGICTPYAAQSKMHFSLNLGESGVNAGTVHRFQGDEKDLMIIDTVDSLGDVGAGFWALHDLPDEDGCRLWNVAISRAKDYLVFIGNLTHLNKKLPKNSFLRSILYNSQQNGDVIDINELLELNVIDEEIQELHKRFVLEDSTVKKGLFNNADFEKVFMQDINSAKKNIAIFSGFITPARVAHYGDIFRSKISEGIKIRCVTRPPKMNGNMKESLGEEALNALEAIGCIVDTRGSIHQKAAIIDDEITWFGSLNPLSHTSKTEETMARIKDKRFAGQLSQNLAIKFSKETEGLSIKKENPECSKCGFHRTSYHFGTYGKSDYFKCENCGANTPTNQRASGKRIANHEMVGKDCPTGCGGTIRVVNGRYGEFLSCTNYKNKNCSFKPPSKKVAN